MTFKTKIDWVYKTVIAFVFIAWIISLFLNYNGKQFLLPIFTNSIFFALLIAFLIFSIKYTSFSLTEDKLICKTLFIKREIEYNRIRKIEKQTSIYSGVKIATSFKGIVVYFDKYDDILISPENEELFMSEINKKIVLTNAPKVNIQ